MNLGTLGLFLLWLLGRDKSGPIGPKWPKPDVPEPARRDPDEPGKPPVKLDPIPPNYRPISPVTQWAVQRAWELLPKLRMGEVKLEREQGGARTLAFRKEPHAGGKTGVTVYGPA